MKLICLGHYNTSAARRKQPSEAILELLSKGKEILMMGYRTGANPYNPLTADRWRNWMTKSEIDRQGYVCLNDFGDDRNVRNRY
jgi:hypothetical protein